MTSSLLDATTIVQPGAYGTSFMANTLQPQRPQLLNEYGAVKQMFEAFYGNFEQMIEAGQIGDPQEVADAIVEVVESEPGQRPLRRPVGADLQEPVGAINGVCAQVQDGLLTAFGLK